jgi:hypothetical protein
LIKLIDILKEIKKDNPNDIVLPFNIYYIGNSTSELRNIGLDQGTITEPELMGVLWSEYQQMKEFTRTVQSGGDKTTNKMQDAGLNIDLKSDADGMFFGERLQEIMDEIELYVSEGTPIVKQENDNGWKDGRDIYYNIYEDDEGNDFNFSKQEADKYQYELGDDEFKQFTETIKQVLN